MNNDVDTRIVRLEKSCRNWRWIAGLALLIGTLALVTPALREARSALPGASTAAPGTPPSFDRLRVKFLEVVDDKGNTVVSMHEGAGGGIMSVSSTTPNDHVVMIMASPHGATVQVSSQQKPRQFGFLQIMDRKPYLQMYEEHGDGKSKNFYQAPLYSADGSISTDR